jgi:catechol 2,3-dioxygenase-like lactoylglutathione lyase family enzyme
LGPIGQISRHVPDIKTAENWYRDVLGLPHMFTFGNLSFFDCGGTRLFLSAEENESNRDVQHESTLYFTVTGIDAAHEELKRRGVTFTSAPHVIHRHQDGTEEWMAFFEDLDGGVLALMERVKKAS